MILIGAGQGMALAPMTASGIQGLPCAPEIALREALAAALIVSLQHRTPRWV